MPLSKEQEDELAGLLAAVRHPPMPLAEKLSTVEMLRKWGVWVLGVIVTVVVFVMQVRQNSRILEDLSPKVKMMWWMKENGYTNKDVEPIGPIKLPKFD